MNIFKFGNITDSSTSGIHIFTSFSNFTFPLLIFVNKYIHASFREYIKNTEKILVKSEIISV